MVWSKSVPSWSIYHTTIQISYCVSLSTSLLILVPLISLCWSWSYSLLLNIIIRLLLLLPWCRYHSLSLMSKSRWSMLHIIRIIGPLILLLIRCSIIHRLICLILRHLIIIIKLLLVLMVILLLFTVRYWSGVFCICSAWLLQDCNCFVNFIAGRSILNTKFWCYSTFYELINFKTFVYHSIKLAFLDVRKINNLNRILLLLLVLHLLHFSIIINIIYSHQCVPLIVLLVTIFPSFKTCGNSLSWVNVIRIVWTSGFTSQKVVNTTRLVLSFLTCWFHIILDSFG